MIKNTNNHTCDAPSLMPIEQARLIIQQTITPVTEQTHCLLSDALDAVVCCDIVSPINVPSYNNSAMDGYALNSSDLSHADTLQQVGKSFAGKPFTRPIEQGECVRIMTGAKIPEGADTVVMQENTQANNESITFLQPVTPGQAIRLAGDDIKQGSVVLSKGKRISAIDIGLLASLGINTIPVYRQLTVAVFSTGDELVEAGQAAKANCIFDSNRPMLIAMLKRMGAKVIDMGIVDDNKSRIHSAFEQADMQADCVITSGGVSVGEADYTREILEEYGSVDFWKLAIKPGKPLAFGRLPNSIFFGLPGNPVSSAVTFDQIAAPAIAYMSGQTLDVPMALAATATTNIKKRPGRTDYQRAHYSTDKHGQLVVNVAASQSSGVLSGFSSSNCYAVLESERGNVAEGETVSILPFCSRIV